VVADSYLRDMKSGTETKLTKNVDFAPEVTQERKAPGGTCRCDRLSPPTTPTQGENLHMAKKKGKKKDKKGKKKKK